MGLLQFIKSVGVGKIDASEIEQKIKEDLGNQISEIKVDVDGEGLIINGLCESLEAREKAVLIAGNTKGVSSVSYFGLKIKKTASPQNELPEQAAKIKEVNTEPDQREEEKSETEFYTIVSGDTLSKIAKKYYGDANKYPVLFDANREVIKHPDKIYVGQMIRIPKI